MHLLIRSAIYRFLSTTHRFIIKFATLFLKLVITHVKSVPAHTVITHSHLVLLVKMLLHIVLLFHYVILVIVSTNSTVLTKNRSFYLLTTHTTLPVVTVTCSGSVSVVVVVNTMRVLRSCLTTLSTLHVLRPRTRLHDVISRITGTVHLLS